MRRFRTLAALVLVGPLLATAGLQYLAPAPTGAAAGASSRRPCPPICRGTSSADMRRALKKARAAGLKPVAVADYVSQQELDLRRESAGTGVDVIRSGDRLFVRAAVERHLQRRALGHQPAGDFDLGRNRR